MDKFGYVFPFSTRRCPLYLKKKRAIVLFEILIGLSLTAILLTFLFNFLVESTKLEKKLETARGKIFERAECQTRLQTIFGAIDGPAYTKQVNQEKITSFIFQYNNGIDPTPYFSGSLIARLFLDKEGNLSIITWPIEKEKQSNFRKEVLFSNVKSYEIEFLSKINAKEHGKKDKIKQITPNLCWKNQLSSRDTFSIIRLTLNEKNQKTPTQFAFILPTKEPIVSYQAGAK